MIHSTKFEIETSKRSDEKIFHTKNPGVGKEELYPLSMARGKKYFQAFIDGDFSSEDGFIKDQGTLSINQGNRKPGRDAGK